VAGVSPKAKVKTVNDETKSHWHIHHPHFGSRMSDRPTVFSQYLASVRRAIDAIEATQLPAIRAAADQFAKAILKGRLVHVFGTGHSRIAVEEMFPRYGSFPGFHPIVELSMTYHNNAVGANGQRQAMFLENVQGFGPVLWRNFAISPDDALLAISTSGCNAVTIDVAQEAARLGMFVVAMTSLAHAAVSTSRHESGKKLHEVGALAIDHNAPPGDSAVWIDGLDTPVAPLSSVTSCAVVNLLKAEVARLLTEAGYPPKVLTAACNIGAERSRQLFEETYDDYRRRVGVLYR
jgi:uncharacterized phosphosugar-binding protein